MQSAFVPRFIHVASCVRVSDALGTLLNRRPPAESDFQRFFQVTPPAVHQMIVELERRGLISRVPSQPRTIKVTFAGRGVAAAPTDQNLCGGVVRRDKPAWRRR
jgi:hypothetical protein